MAVIKQMVWSEGSDNPQVKFQTTQNTLNKEKENAKFDLPVIKEFVNDKTRKMFNHKCDKCMNKAECDKWQGKIIVTCEEIRR